MRGGWHGRLSGHRRGNHARFTIAAGIATAGAAAIGLMIRDAVVAVTVPGTVTGYRRRPGIDGELDHPVIEYTGPEGGQVRLDSGFGMRFWQRLAPWRLGASIAVRTDRGSPRHHAPRATCVMAGLVTAFLVILVLVAG